VNAAHLRLTALPSWSSVHGGTGFYTSRPAVVGVPFGQQPNSQNRGRLWESDHGGLPAALIVNVALTTATARWSGTTTYTSARAAQRVVTFGNHLH